MTQPATRLLTLILLMQRQPLQTAAQLAKKLGVSVRTLHRYMGMLDEMGIPITSERGPNGGFSLVRGYKMPPLIFSPEEATAVCLGASLVEEIWGPLYREAALGALVKLDNVLPDEQRQEVAWARRSLVTTGLLRPNVKEQDIILATLRQALRESRRVRLVYQSGGQANPLARELDPYALVHRWGWWYVIGFCQLRQEVRSFRLDRVRELQLTNQSYEPPQSFDAQAFLSQEFAQQPQIKVRMRFEPSAANIARSNHSSWNSLEEAADGSVVVSFLSPDLIWATGMVLSFGPLVTVLDPPEIRQSVSEWAGAVAKLYENSLDH
jgi:predicted DNA-binding transcriptional regulator YafY